MDFTPLIDQFGEPATIAFGAILIGLLFGFFAQKSRFCLRSAVIEIAESLQGKQLASGLPWRALAVWLVAFSTALLGTQLLLYAGQLDVEGVRQLTSSLSLSGSVIGGLLFGCGMILCRGCPSRLWVLSATGNLRAFTTFLAFAGFVYLTLVGSLNPLRSEILQLWLLSPDFDLHLISHFEGPAIAGLVAASGLALLSLFIFWRVKLSVTWLFGALFVGTSIFSGWWFTYQMSGQVFDPIPVESLSFTRPAYDVLAFASSGFLIEKMNFGVGILVGVLLGAFLAACFARELSFAWFHSFKSFIRYLSGGAMMGFGAVLAGGCAVGAGVTGGAIYSITALISLFAMILAAMVTKFIIDGLEGRQVIKGRDNKTFDIQPAE